jgi:paraquat-inducible protein B
METYKKIRQIQKRVSRLQKAIKEILREIKDYDLERLLKKVDAECMDVQHNLASAERMLERLTQKKKKKKANKNAST